MNNIIDFKKPTVLSCPYFMSYTDEKGTAHKAELTGEEVFSTICPECGEEHTIDFDILADIVKENGLYGAMVYCSECSSKRQHP